MFGYMTKYAEMAELLAKKSEEIEKYKTKYLEENRNNIEWKEKFYEKVNDSIAKRTDLNDAILKDYQNQINIWKAKYEGAMAALRALNGAEKERSDENF